MESACFILKDDKGKDDAVFTGDTLFLGDVGRPGLAQKADNVTSEDLAGLLYDHLQTKIMPLTDDVIAIKTISAVAFAEILMPGETMVLDVRRHSGCLPAPVADAYNKPLDNIHTLINALNPKQHFYLHCAGGYGSMMAASFLEARGFRNFTGVLAGFAAIEQTDARKTDFVCQRKLLPA
ncbi:MAG: hypothetical protein ABIX01_08190 [Chitinophagaceae bacterium]